MQHFSRYSFASPLKTEKVKINEVRRKGTERRGMRRGEKKEARIWTSEANEVGRKLKEAERKERGTEGKEGNELRSPSQKFRLRHWMWQ
jgi:hypothetical protein